MKGLFLEIMKANNEERRLQDMAVTFRLALLVENSRGNGGKHNVKVKKKGKEVTKVVDTFKNE